MLLDHVDDIKTLEDLGLTLSQAKVYLTAANLGKAKARDLWQKSGVGRQELYRILDQLLEIGLIEKQISSPILFRSVPLSEGALILYNRKRSEILKLKTEIKKLLHDNKKMETAVSLESEFLVLPRRHLMENRGKHSYSSARKSIEFLSPFKRLMSAFAYNRDVYSDVVKRGVEMRVVTEKVSVNQDEQLKKGMGDLLYRNNFRLRIAAPFGNTAFSIIDRKEGYFPLDPDKSVFEDQTLWTNNKSLILLAHNYFDMLWNRGVDPHNSSGELSVLSARAS